MNCCLEADPNNAAAIKANTNCYWNSGGPQTVGVFELKARYNPIITTKELYDVDLRNTNKVKFQKHTEEYGMETSLSRTEIHKTSVKAFFEASVSAAVEVLDIGANYGVDFTHELTHSIKQTSSKYWKRTKETEYYLEAGDVKIIFFKLVIPNPDKVIIFKSDMTAFKLTNNGMNYFNIDIIMTIL